MPVDIAELGLKVRSDGVIVASDRLRKLSRAANDAESAATRLAKSADKVGRSMQKMGRSLTMYVTAPIIAAAAASVKLGATFDSTLAQMNTLVGVSRKELAGFRKELLLMGPAVGRGPIELADALFAVTSAGQRGAQALDTLKKAAMASAVGLGDTRTIALAATAAVQAYGKANMDSTRSLEILIGTIEQGNLEASSLAPVLGRVIGMASELGVAFEDLGAFIATFTRLGVLADEAATSLRGVLSTIQKPTSEATEAFTEMETSIDEVRRAIREKGFIVTFQDLVNRSRKFNVDLVSIVPNVRALSGVLGVFGGEGTVAMEVLEGVSAAVGTLEDRFKAVQELDPTHAFKEMKAELQALFITLSRDLLPAVLTVVGEIKEWAKAFKELNPETQTMLIRTALLTAAVGPFLIVLGSAVRLLGFLIPLIPKLALLITTRLIPALISLATFLGPAGAIILGFTALILLIGDKYVEGIEKGILGTKRYIGTLDELRRAADMLGLQFNLDAVNAQIIHNLRLQKTLQAELTESTPLLAGVESPWLDKLRQDIAQLERELGHLKKLREQYESDIDLFTEIEVDTQKLEDLAGALSGLEVVKLTDDEADALAALVDELDPAAKATKDFADAQALLEKALKAGVKNGGISIKMYSNLVRALHVATDAFADAIGVFDELDVTVMANLETSMAYMEGLEEMEQQLQAVADSLDPTGAALREMADAQELLNKAFDEGVFEGREDEFYALSDAIQGAVSSIELMDSAFQRGAQEWLTTLQGMQGLFHEDSAAAEALRSAMLALNIIMGIHAVLVQLAKGDVYSAIPRALAVAAMVAGMGINTGAAGSSAANRSLQERQGTGTLLGDAEAKSESLLRAMEITADATSELVGINRGMLHALQAMQAGLSGASTILARGSNDADFTGALPSGDLPGLVQTILLGGPLGKLVDNLLGGFLSGLLNKFFGGKSKVLDEGIRIIGGSLGDMMNEVFVQAFLRYKAKKHIFDDYDEYWQFQNLPDEVGRQFALVFGAIYDTVFEAAVALGMDPATIAARLDEFVLDDIDISLMDLSGDELQEELLAVFSSIFDDVAEHVMPWIIQFQQVGEGLGETLVRVATSVQVFREAIGALGLIVDETDPEAFAIMAVGLVELTGGVEEFIAKFSTFFDKFASDEQKLEFATNQITRAFEQVGLELPETRDGMIDLMMSLDATTEAGRRNIAMLLDIADTADAYYTLVDRAEEERLKQAQEFAALMEGYRDAITDFLDIRYQPLVELTRAFKDAMEAADALSASQREYAMIARKFAADLRIMAAQLTLNVLSIADRLFGSGAAASLTQPIQEGFEETREVVNQIFIDWQRALESIHDFSQSLLLDERLTTLTPAEQLNEAQSQFYDVLARAQSGDVDAAAALPDAAQAYLEEARFMFASGAQYTEIFNAVMAALDSISMPAGIEEFETVIIENPNAQTEADYLASALAQELERFLLAAELAESLNHLAQVLGVSVIALAAELGIPLDQLVEILGFELNNLTVESASAIGGIADILGADIFELLDALGVGLGDLAIAFGINLDELSKDLVIALGAFAAALGEDALLISEALGLSIDDLAKTFGIGIDAFSAEQFRALVEFSNALGAGVADVAKALDINLGEIADATSILSQALDREISALPPEIQLELSPLLTAIRDATTEADANVAIQALGAYILGLPPEIAAPLIPFLELMGFHNISAELAAIMSIERHTFNALGTLGSIVRAINNLDLSVDVHVTNTTTTIIQEVAATGKDKGSTEPVNPGNSPEGIPQPVFLAGVGWYTPQSYDRGGRVEETGMHMLHAGEFVVNRERNNIVPPSNDGGLTRTELREIKNVLVDIRESNRRYQEDDVAATRDVGSAINDQAETIRRFANDR